ncbi:UPF0149 family protein [Halorhodospira halochloris]|uniref:UPF0149 family protein n=1 Tax=Halorhodospira halochloris TaxID=1052 RepID=UPI0023792956|nr:UPF0149 family protein [Halorhodospira halochloris]
MIDNEYPPYEESISFHSQIRRLVENDDLQDEEVLDGLLSIVTSDLPAELEIQIDSPRPESVAELYEAIEDHGPEIPKNLFIDMAWRLASRQEDIWQRLALYWALDTLWELRHIVLLCFLSHAQDKTLSPYVRARLPIIAHWLPDEECAELVADIIDDAPTDGSSAKPVFEQQASVDGIYLSIPEGGALQHLAITGHNEGEHFLGLVELEVDSGFYSVETLCGLDQRQLSEELELLQIDSPLGEATPDIAIALLNNALASQLESEEPPPASLIDLVTIFALQGQIAPEPISTRQWLDILDPDNKLESLTPQKRGRLINQSAKWAEQFPIVDTWFDDNPESASIIDAYSSPNKRELELRRHLDVDRRPWWAEHCFRSALALQQGWNQDTWMSFAAVGKALLDGRELRKIPIFDSILSATLEAHERGCRCSGSSKLDEDLDGDPFSDPSLRPESLHIPDKLRQSLEGFYNREHAKAVWDSGFMGLHGYLFAIATHPEPISPSEWLGPLLNPDDQSQAGVAANKAEFSEIIGNLLQLYNVINSQVFEGVAELPEGCTLKSEPMDNFHPDAPVSQWARGFRTARSCFGHLLDWLDEAREDMPQNSQERENWEMEVAEVCGFSTMALEIFADRQKAERVCRGAQEDNEKTTIENMAKFAHTTFYESFSDIAIFAGTLRRDIDSDDDEQGSMGMPAGTAANASEKGEPRLDQIPFSTPSTQPPQQPGPQQPARSNKVGRNEPCPCGSGKKYKRCCGDPRNSH